MFLNPLLEVPQGPWVLRNLRTGAVLARRLETAFDSETRRRGLLGRQDLPAGSAVIIAPCSGIHTFFMRFPIDVVFAGRDGRVVKVYHGLPAWRIGFGWKGFAAIELPAGTLRPSGTVRGDLLQIVR
jgi:uncharacterized membrane protein (UPF0127 family)